MWRARTHTGAARGAVVALIAATAVTATGAGAPAADRKQKAQAGFRPVDEATKDPAFFLFRARLQRAVATKDGRRLKSLLHSRVLVGAAGREGRRHAIRVLEKRPVLWLEMARVLAMGGRFVSGAWTDGQRRRGFVAPYTYFAATRADQERKLLVVAAANANLRAKPTPRAEVIKTLSHQVVHVDRRQRGRKAGWVQVETQDGARGWISRRLLRSPAGYRAYFIREQGRWRLAAFTRQ